MSSQENTPPRQARDRHLSLKATEIFEHKRLALANSIDQYVKRIDQCISDLEDPDDMVLARKNVQNFIPSCLVLNIAYELCFLLMRQ